MAVKEADEDEDIGEDITDIENMVSNKHSCTLAVTNASYSSQVGSLRVD